MVAQISSGKDILMFNRSIIYMRLGQSSIDLVIACERRMNAPPSHHLAVLQMRMKMNLIPWTVTNIKHQFVALIAIKHYYYYNMLFYVMIGVYMFYYAVSFSFIL